jgi:predicted aldo/keto reductase-like oxidoreductase
MELNNNIERRKFLKVLSGVTAASVGLAYACNTPNSKNKNSSNIISEGDVPVDKMTYRTNSVTGDKVSLLGFGCMRLPTRPVKGSDDEEIDQDAVNELVDYALAHSVNYFDTAPIYCNGLSEHSMGLALSRHPRNKYMVATKMSTFMPDPAKRSLEASKALYHNSMKELKVDYIDYYLLHGIGIGGMKDFNERFIDNGVLDFLLKEREAGRIRNLGWSFHGDQAVFDHMLQMEVKWDFAQIQLNYVDWKHASDGNVNADYLYGELVKHAVPAVIMEPLLGGRLAKLSDYSTAQLKQLQPQASIASWAFRYAGSPSEVITVLSGMTYKEHLQDNIRTYSPLQPVTDEEKIVLEDVAQMLLKYPTVPCTECRYCMPCPYGINIPGVFAHYNRCVNEGNVPKDAQDKEYSKARRAFLVGYDRSVPKLSQANHCIGCNQCLPACPQSINIPSEMARIDEFVESLKQQSTVL